LCKDAAEAEAALRIACSGSCTAAGNGVQMDPVEALKHAERAVELGEDPRVLELFDAPPLQARVKLGTGGDRCRGGAVCRCYFVA